MTFRVWSFVTLSLLATGLELEKRIVVTATSDQICLTTRLYALGNKFPDTFFNVSYLGK